MTVKHISEVLTAIENQFVLVESLIGDTNNKMVEFHRILGRRNNRDLFVDDCEYSEWVGIRFALLDEAKRYAQRLSGSLAEDVQ